MNSDLGWTLGAGAVVVILGGALAFVALRAARTAQAFARGGSLQYDGYLSPPSLTETAAQLIVGPAGRPTSGPARIPVRLEAGAAPGEESRVEAGDSTAMLASVLNGTWRSPAPAWSGRDVPLPMPSSVKTLGVLPERSEPEWTAERYAAYVRTCLALRAAQVGPKAEVRLRVPVGLWMGDLLRETLFRKDILATPQATEELGALLVAFRYSPRVVNEDVGED